MSIVTALCAVLVGNLITGTAIYGFWKWHRFPDDWEGPVLVFITGAVTALVGYASLPT